MLVSVTPQSAEDNSIYTETDQQVRPSSGESQVGSLPLWATFERGKVAQWVKVDSPFKVMLHSCEGIFKGGFKYLYHIEKPCEKQ
jgi:hypothetical protein